MTTIVAGPASATELDFARFLIECAIAARQAGQQAAPLSLPAGYVRGENAHVFSSDLPAGVSDRAPAGPRGGDLFPMTSTLQPKPQAIGGSHEKLIIGR